MGWIDAPEAHYLLMGRLTVAAARLEFIAGMPAHVAAGEQSPVDEWDRLAGAPGQVLGTLKAACKELANGPHPDDVRGLEQFGEQVRECLNRRSAFVHAFVVMDWRADPDDGVTLHLPRTGGRRPLPTAEEVGRLVARMDALADRALMLTDLASRLRSGQPGQNLYLTPLPDF